MYSPKIKEEYIPVLYKLAKTRGIPMTHLVKEAIDEFLSKPETKLLQTQTLDNNHNQL